MEADQVNSGNEATNRAVETAESPRPALERCPHCHTAYVDGSTDACPKAPALERHSFIVMNSTTDTACIAKGCGQTRESGNHYTAEDVEKILERRRAIMPDYDKRLKEWLS